ncbi:polysaccharide biosynthesis C-terminal domain-containing protein [Mycolicibacterium hippocampi]|uniref:Polysaccharide biosynthesis protein n=1 Tax=Mycolicibacterium hippocampi TaxID=659824 RepID=A0A850Q0H7_9MYCO|nr:polysaccharide biosynthesis C-terminal domain-containing protein [Mycolicibacterium hippocampi]NVN53730.1 hypothetical protein [Mycolicibacterium hippocampi]
MTVSRPEVARGLLGNSVALLATTQITALLGYAFWMLCAHWVPASVIGITNTVIAAMTLVAILAVAGYIPMLPRLLPGATAEERSGVCSAAFVLTVIVSGLVGVAAALLLPQRLHAAVGTGWLMVLVSTGAVGTAMLLVINAALLGVRRADLSLLGSVAASLARLIVIAAIVTSGVAAAGAGTSSVHTILIVWIVSLWISGVLSIWLLVRAAPGFRFSPGPMWFSLVWRSVAWDHVATLALRAPALALPILASAHLPPTEVGYLVVAVMIASAFLAVPGAVSNALLADCADDPARLRAQTRRALCFAAVLLIPPVIITCLLARVVLGLFGSGYADYSLVLILLLLSTFPDALINVALAALRVMRRLTEVAVVTVLGATITIGGTWLLMPSMGVSGAIVALFASQAIALAALSATLVRGSPVSAENVSGEHKDAPGLSGDESSEIVASGQLSNRRRDRVGRK